MRLQKAAVSNYMGIEHLEVDFKPGINLFIGNNGAGKTSLLNALALIVSQSLRQIHAVSCMKIGNDVRTTTSLVGETTADTVYHYPVEINAEILFEGELYQETVKKNSEASVEGAVYYLLATKIASMFQSSEENHVLPLLCFQRAGRGTVLKKNNNGTVQISNKQPERTEGYQGAFSPVFDIETVQKWCLQMELSEYQKKRPIQEYRTFKKIIGSFMSVLDEHAEAPTIYYSSDQAAMVYSDGKTIQPLYNLSAGYQSILCLIMELAYRSVLLNPALGDVNEKIEGIVFVDEIEIHLHPKWQWKILNALHETFPKVQLIVASHSPMVLSSVKDAALYLMTSPNEVIPLESAYGYSVNDVLDLRLGSDDSPKEVKAYFSKIENLIDTEDKQGIETLLKQAKQQFGENSALFRRIREFASIFYLLEDK